MPAKRGSNGGGPPEMPANEQNRDMGGPAPKPHPFIKMTEIDDDAAVMGRPRTEIDMVQFRKLLQIQCTLPEIAAYFACGQSTIERFCQHEFQMSFGEIRKQTAPLMQMALRRKQIAMALEGDRTMLIWTGKQYLGQTENGQITDEESRKEAEARQLPVRHVVKLVGMEGKTPEQIQAEMAKFIDRPMAADDSGE